MTKRRKRLDNSASSREYKKMRSDKTFYREEGYHKYKSRRCWKKYRKTQYRIAI